MGALCSASGVVGDLVLCCNAVHARLVVVGITVSGRGEFGEDGVERGSQFRIEPPRDAAHAINFLPPDGEAALAGVLAFVVQCAVLVEVAHQLPGGFAKSIRG